MEIKKSCRNCIFRGGSLIEQFWSCHTPGENDYISRRDNCKPGFKLWSERKSVFIQLYNKFLNALGITNGKSI